MIAVGGGEERDAGRRGGEPVSEDSDHKVFASAALGLVEKQMRLRLVIGLCEAEILPRSR